jgi:flagellin
MSLIINTNVGSLNAQRSLAASGAELKTAMERLSSGKKINSAADDAAGFAIAERMTAQILGLNMATKNANDGLSMLAVIENATNDVTDMLQRMRELTIQAANDTNGLEDRTFLQKEVSALIEEIDRVATQTQYNNQLVLNGSFQNKSIQVGTEAGQTVDVSISGIASQDLGVIKPGYKYDGSSSRVSYPGPIPPANSHTSSEDIELQTASGNFTVAALAGASAKSMAEEINSISASSGVVATAKTNALIWTPANATSLLQLKINGEQTGSFEFGSTNIGSAVQAINNISGVTGVTAEAVGSIATGLKVLLTSKDGHDITIENDSAITSLKVESGDDEGWVTVMSLMAAGGNDSTRIMGQISLFSESAYSVLVSGIPDEGYFAQFGTAEKVGIDVVTGATDALTKITAAIEQVAGHRATYGALQNRLEYTVSNLMNVAEFTTSARSRIEDADFAAESARLAKAQVLQQTGTAMLAQANAQPQLVLSLIR